MLKQFLALNFIVLFFGATAQVTDDFSDGDISINPTWQGNTDKFVTNSSEQLQLNSSGADTSCLVTSCTSLQNMEWKFWVKLSLAPSDNNYVKIYLSADQPNLKGPVNGYYIRMGENGAFDSVDLWEQNGTVQTKIVDGINGHCARAINTLRIKVTHDSTGLWTVYSDTLGGTNYLVEGSTVNNTFAVSPYFGMSCKYTSSNSTKFYFDDIYAGPVIIDTVPPFLSEVLAVSTSVLDIYFTEALDKLSAENESNYFVDGAIGYPINAIHDNSNPGLVHLTFSNLMNLSHLYTISINGIKDIKQNVANSLFSTFVLPEQVEANDVVINEILAEPYSSGVDFMEIYNRSNKVLDLSQIRFASFDTVSGMIKSSYLISAERKLFFPGEYYVLSTDPIVVKNQYVTTNPGGFIQMTTIPAMNIESGTVALTDTTTAVIDKVSYYQSMHFPLLNSTKGISLERISTERNSMDKSNWHSAAESCGGATPAFKNSQSAEVIYEKEISVTPEIFSPDNDGYNDAVTIAYLLNDPGSIATVNIYDKEGRLIRSLVQNQLLGTSGAFSWDGITNNQEKVPVGIYIIHFQIVNKSGNTKNIKKSTVLAAKLN